MARFCDPNGVRVQRFVEWHNTGYLVMDFEEGETLAARLKCDGVIAESEAITILSASQW